MSALQIMFLGVQGIVFLAWAAMMFHTLFLFRRRAAAETGQSFPGTMQFIGQVSRWLTAPEDRAGRLTLLALTVLLLANIALSAILAGAG